jgi:hypothetical protein
VWPISFFFCISNFSPKNNSAWYAWFFTTSASYNYWSKHSRYCYRRTHRRDATTQDAIKLVFSTCYIEKWQQISSTSSQLLFAFSLIASNKVKECWITFKEEWNRYKAMCCVA